MRIPPLSVYSAAFAATLLLTGCSLTPTAKPIATAGLSIRGNVHGGQQPIIGAHIYMLAAGTTGYGAASTSLLTSGTDGTDSIGGYVLTDNNGSFSYGGDYTCIPGTQVYLYAQGGDPGAGPNTAAGLLAALGNCPAAGNFATAVPFVWVNEVSTVAAAYAMAGYGTDATHVSSSGTPLAQTGIANAFANATNLAGITTGSALTTTPAGNGTVPAATINTLANILASCVNSTGPASTPCTTLFSAATSDGTPTGTAPTDTATAILNIAHNPGANVAALFGIPAPVAAFGPALAVQPNDFSLALTFTGGGIAASQGLAVDAQGNIWAADGSNAILEYNSLGAPLSGSTGFTDPNLNSPTGIAIDSSANVWASNAGGGNIPLVQFNSAGGFLAAPAAPVTDFFYNPHITPAGDILIPSLHNGAGLFVFSPTGTYTGIYATPNLADGVAIQADGTIWTSNDGANSLTQLSNSGTVLSGAGFDSGIANPGPVALDASGNVWTLNGNANVGEVTSAGALVSGSPFNTSSTQSASKFVLDGVGRAWISTNVTVSNPTPTTTYSLTVLSNAGALLPGNSGYISPAQQVNDVQIDGSGNVWLSSGTDLTELVGAAAPVVTPASAAVTNNVIATRP